MTAAASHNGRRLQTSLNFLQYGGAFPFLNLVKAAGDLAWADNANAPVTPDAVDGNCYPSTNAHGGISVTFFGPDPVFARPGNRVVKWTTNSGAAPSYNFQRTLQPGTGGRQSSLTPIGGVGRYEFSTTDSRYQIILPYDVRDVVFCHVDDEDRLTNGEVFGVDLKAAASMFGVIRFLDWAFGNTTNVTTWSTRKPSSYLFYHGDERRASIYGSPATRSGLAYSCTGPAGFAYADKATFSTLFQDGFSGVLATFTNGSSNVSAPGHGLTSAQIGSPVYIDDEGDGAGGNATYPTNFAQNVRYFIKSVPDADTVTLAATVGGAAIVAGSAGAGFLSLNPVLTMNVSGLGAKEIVGTYCGHLIRGFNNYPVANSYASLATFVYDATLDKLIKHGGCIAEGSLGLQNGVPPELMVQLCAEIGAHPYFVTPPLAIDPATDYMPSLAYYCKTNSPSWSIPRFEPPNELWNTAAGFYQTYYANAKAVAYSWGADFHNWYGKAVSVLGQIASAVFGGDRTKYRVICCIQTASAGSTGNDPRLSSVKYIGTAPQAALTGPWGTITFSAASGVAEAWRWVTTGGCAQYVTPSDYGQSAEATKAATFAGSFFNASIVGDLLTVNSLVDDSAIAAAMTVQGLGAAGAALLNGTQVLAFGSGGTSGNGGPGTYKLNKSQPGLTSSAFAMCGWSDFSQADAYVDTLSTGGGLTNIPSEAANYAAFKTWLQRFGIQEMVGYEGGYSPDAVSGVQSINRLRVLSKLSTHLTDLMHTNYDNWVKLSDGTFVAAYPSYFLLAGPIDTGKVSVAWSILDDLYQNPRPPLWAAVSEVAARGARLRLSTN